MDGVVMVTIPSAVSQDVVKRAVTFDRKLETPVLDVIENMSGLICPHFGEKIDIFSRGGRRKLAEEVDTPFWAPFPWTHA